MFNLKRENLEEVFMILILLILGPLAIKLMDQVLDLNFPLKKISEKKMMDMMIMMKRFIIHLVRVSGDLIELSTSV